MQLRYSGVFCFLTVLSALHFPARQLEARDPSQWRNASYSFILGNEAIEATFQAGLLCKLIDQKTGKILISEEPGSFPSVLPLFGTSGTFDLDASNVTQEKHANGVVTSFKQFDGTEWILEWEILPGKGDLVLRSSARTMKPVEEMRMIFRGCDISQHRAVYVDAYGVSRQMDAPSSNIHIGDPDKDGSVNQVYPLVALFQGKASGWFLEGRDPVTGPACLMLAGRGGVATAALTRRFPLETQTPEMYEIRFRAYQQHWEDAVDPFLAWMEKEGGFVPLDKKPQQWIRDIETQAYVEVGDLDGLEKLAAKVDPTKTFLGRITTFRRFGFDEKYPDYRVVEGAKPWMKRARELGFHLGVHINSKSISVAFPDLVERFKSGLLVTGTDARGNEVYESIYEGQNKLLRVSAALKDWRTYLIEQLKDVVDAGADIIYLDESMGTNGKFVVDGVDGLQGMMLLMKEIQEAYPGVAVETEQFNFMTAKYGAFALSQMPLGHPLSGYLFHRYVKVVPEGVMYSPTSTPLMDAFESWGFMLPGGSPNNEKSGLEIAEAFQKYDLKPDARLPRQPFPSFEKHYSLGLMPFSDSPIPSQGIKLFGYRGRDGIEAYFEKWPNKRGLVVYKPGENPEWVGTRYWGTKTYTGPGVPEYVSFRYTMRDWLIYDKDSIFGLDPAQTYYFDERLQRSDERFHVTKIPDDFEGITNADKRIAYQEVGQNDSYFQIAFRGKGEMRMHGPADYDVFLNGEPLSIDRENQSAVVQIGAPPSAAKSKDATGYVVGNTTMEKIPIKEASILLAVKQADNLLIGKWAALPWMPSIDSGRWMQKKGDDSFTLSVGGIGRILGRLPSSKVVRLKGSYGVSNVGPGPSGDGVVRLNGKEVLRVPAGSRPYKMKEFDVDISEYAGKAVLLEFLSDGWPGRNSSAEWVAPEIVTEAKAP